MRDFNPASVSELVFSIKNLIEEDFSEVMVQGEVSNLSLASSGHCYFTLSDDQASLACALFKADFLKNPGARNIKNGDKIIVLGPVTVYPKKGQFQILVKRIVPAGEGLLKLQFDQLKAKLAQEGLFDLEKKKKIPTFPRKIALITSETGAAIQDFLNVIKRRSLWFEVIIIPTLVQGESASKSLILSLRKSLKLHPIPDLIVFTRGGGSLEDLWAFNNEELVREIYHCPIPVISAIGHHVDYTLCDYVSDLRSETPTAAAETISQPQTELLGRLRFCRAYLERELINYYQKILLRIKKYHPIEVLNLLVDKYQKLSRKLETNRLFDKGSDLIGVPLLNRELDDLCLRQKFSIERLHQKDNEKLKHLNDLLKVLNPDNTLKRGYTYIRKNSDNLVTSFSEFQYLTEKEKLEIVFSDGVGSVTKESL
jgi:exodeoxyribonuclease VII large subunit